MVTLLLWTACVVDPTTGKSIEEVHEDLADIAVSPATLDFGTTDIGSDIALTVTVQNTGAAALQLVDLSVRGADAPFTVGAPGTLAVEAGGSTTFTVTFSPRTPGAATGELHITSTDPDEEDLVLPLAGEAHGAVLVVTPDPIDLGSVAVGCANSVLVTVSNAGDADLLVDEVALTGAAAEISAELPPLPWTLAPGASEAVTLRYAPLDNGADGGSFEVRSTDPIEPVHSVTVGGTGGVEDAAVETFDQGRSTDLDVLVVLSDLSDSARDDARHLVGTWMDHLLAGDMDFHLSVLDTYGCHAGQLPWLDASQTASDRNADLERAIDTDIYTYYADMGLTRADWAVQNNGQGYYMACNAGFFRADAPLVILGVADGDEASPSSWSTYLDVLQDFKGSSGLVTVHAVAPDDPGGCDRYDAGTRWHDVADETGGQYFSFCADDWTGYGDTLGELTPGQRSSWALAQRPVPDTLTVTVDGDPWLAGWSYDAGSNAVVFDPASIPEPEAHVEIAYAVAPGSCP